uniref:Uncharacterized protein n=1 Tax=Anguilla anguilla TaxID=7936 RepID=A0A0E9TQ87_ANGAN
MTFEVILEVNDSPKKVCHEPASSQPAVEKLLNVSLTIVH